MSRYVSTDDDGVTLSVVVTDNETYITLVSEQQMMIYRGPLPFLTTEDYQFVADEFALQYETLLQMETDPIYVKMMNERDLFEQVAAEKEKYRGFLERFAPVRLAGIDARENDKRSVAGTSADA